MIVEDKNTQLIDAIRKAVADKGEDFVYIPPTYDSSCIYFEKNDCPSCLIGYGLAAVGWTEKDLIQKLEHLDDELAERANYKGAQAILAALDYHPYVVVACRNGQIAQDNQRTWGEALKVIHDYLVTHKVDHLYWR